MEVNNERSDRANLSLGKEWPVDDSLSTRDIDRVIAAVKDCLPDICVWQLQTSLPADDDGIWWFGLPDVSKDIQLENSYGSCPFLVETDEQSSFTARHAFSIEQATQMVVEYLMQARGRVDLSALNGSF